MKICSLIVSKNVERCRRNPFMKSSFRLKGLVYLSLVGVLSVGSAYAASPAQTAAQLGAQAGVRLVLLLVLPRLLWLRFRSVLSFM